MTQDAFFELSERLFRELRDGEQLYCSLSGEQSDFVRLNGNRIRQAGAVRGLSLSLDLTDGRRQMQGACDLSGDTAADLRRARTLLERLRERLPHLPDDPFLNYSSTPTESDRRTHGTIPESGEAIADLLQAAEGLDLVGIWANGELLEGLASSYGHQHWHVSTSFNLDFSCYLEADKAVKANLGGFDWKPQDLRRKLEASRRDLAIMARPARSVRPGRYRAYLAPAAVAEITEMLGWGGFGLKDHRTSQTPLLRLARGEKRLDPRITLREDHARGIVPRFTPEGYGKPSEVRLIADGTYRDCLTDSRSAKEFGAPVNASGEYPESLAMDPGEIAAADILGELGTGLFIGNLWYLNYSDRNDCRITGMTRFGTFWVENGQPVAPVRPMRFDDSLYRLFGTRVEGLSRERELLMSPETYDGRSAASALMPGILVDGIELAL